MYLQFLPTDGSKDNIIIYLRCSNQDQKLTLLKFLQVMTTDLDVKVIVKVIGYLKPYMIEIHIWKTSFVTSNQNLWLCRNFVLMSSSSLHAWKII